jgi:D-alanyl-D-alanine carboxypeptidase/D-alanyl-D-alanine-endopeptidase (penicillin-binding protein 4)
VLVTDLETGNEILAHRATQPFVPASATKLVTAAAALGHWGPSFRFETPVLAAGPLNSEGVLEGDLWIVGRGDPSLVSEELWKLAEELRLKGLREVRGRLGIDSTYFDRVRWHPDWPAGSRRAYQAPVAGFAANYSSFRIDVSPAPQLGGPLRLEVAPLVGYFRVDPGGRTLGRSGQIQLELEPRADGSGEIVRLRGSMRAGEPTRTYWRSVVYPEVYAGEVLRATLAAQGIELRSGVRVGQAPADAQELMRHRGETLGRVVWKLNKFSNNFIAEQLTKALGAEKYGPPGTWTKGRTALRAFLEENGSLADGESIEEGSGLSTRNRLSAATLVGLLARAVRSFESGPELLSSLPLGGHDGTLEDRMEGEGPLVRAKTGHLRGVAALCGIVADSSGRRLAFAILVNGAHRPADDVDAVLDSFVSRLAEGIEATD